MHKTNKAATTTVIVHPRLKRRASAEDGYGERSRLDEARGLAAAINLDVLHAETVTIAKPNPATYLGEGTVLRLADFIKENSIELVVVDGHLSPGQQRNLEKAWNSKVIDRTGLILEIFGERARTREGQLQVELAHLSYQKSRLVRSWTHLERQRGGFGFLGGPGETQIEIDRRLIGERITRLKKELETVTRTRGLHRDARRRIPYPIVALVGYTNAGKSTLFNTLTKANVVALDQLFATLDPTMRQLRLPSGRTVILSDTVGFVSDLPHELVAACRATLEEVLESDVIVHVRDIAHPESTAQKRDVEDVLQQLGVEADGQRPVIEALNKIDLLGEDEYATISGSAKRSPDQVAISAVSGEGLERLLDMVDHQLGQLRRALDVAVPLQDGETIAWLYRRGEVLNRTDGETEAQFSVLLDAADTARLEKRGLLLHRAAE